MFTTKMTSVALLHLPSLSKCIIDNYWVHGSAERLKESDDNYGTVISSPVSCWLLNLISALQYASLRKPAVLIPQGCTTRPAARIRPPKEFYSAIGAG